MKIMDTPYTKKEDSDENNNEDEYRVFLLKRVSKKGLQDLNLDELERLQELVEKKDYSHDKKAHKSKMRLLSEIYSKINEIRDSKDS